MRTGFHSQCLVTESRVEPWTRFGSVVERECCMFVGSLGKRYTSNVSLKQVSKFLRPNYVRSGHMKSCRTTSKLPGIGTQRVGRTTTPKNLERLEGFGLLLVLETQIFSDSFLLLPISSDD